MATNNNKRTMNINIYASFEEKAQENQNNLGHYVQADVFVRTCLAVCFVSFMSQLVSVACTRRYHR